MIDSFEKPVDIPFVVENVHGNADEADPERDMDVFCGERLDALAAPLPQRKGDDGRAFFKSVDGGYDTDAKAAQSGNKTIRELEKAPADILEPDLSHVVKGNLESQQRLKIVCARHVLLGRGMKPEGHIFRRMDRILPLPHHRQPAR